ncbi:MAG: hypothetical protein ABL974_11035 [Prosthecobacter sp.]
MENGAIISMVAQLDGRTISGLARQRPNQLSEMICFDDYPYAPIREALGTILGRIALVALSILISAMLAGVTATRSLAGIVIGLVTLPAMIPISLFWSVGFFVLPFLVIFTCMFARSEWPLRSVVICVILMWWNLHGTMRWAFFDSPLVKQEEKLQSEMQNALEASRQNSQTIIDSRPR